VKVGRHPSPLQRAQEPAPRLLMGRPHAGLVLGIMTRGHHPEGWQNGN
jgi:hypothetical protein